MTLRVCSLVWAAIAAVGLTAGTARAQGNGYVLPAEVASRGAEADVPLRYTVSLDLDTLWRRDASYQLFSGKERDPSMGLSVGYEALTFGARGTAVVGLGFQNEALNRDWGNTNAADLDVNTFYAFSTLRWSLRRWLEPQIDLAAGASHGEARLAVDGTSDALEGRAWSMLARVGGGVRFRTPQSHVTNSPLLSGLALSLSVNGGMQLGTPLDLAVRAPAPEDDKIANDLIPSSSTKLGNLGRTYPYVRVSFALHF